MFGSHTLPQCWKEMVNRCREGCYLASKCSTLRWTPALVVRQSWGRVSTLLILNIIFLVVNDPCWTDHLCARWAVLLGHCSGDCMWHVTVWHQEGTWSCQRTVQGPTVCGVCCDRQWGGCLRSGLFFAVLELHELHSGLSFTVIGEKYCCHEKKTSASVLKGHHLKVLYFCGIWEFLLNSFFYPRKQKNSGKKEYCKLKLSRREYCRSHS